MFRIFLQGIYSILVSPFVYFTFSRSYSFYRLLTGPLLSGPLEDKWIVQQIDKAVFCLDSGDYSPEEFILKVSGLMREALVRGELDELMARYDERAENRDITLARKLFFRPMKWWYLKVHFMKEGNRHGLHAHRNVLSTQVIARGRLKVQEFDRLTPLQPPKISLALRFSGDAKVGDALMSTDTMANVHGFEPYSEGAVRFQFYLRGHTKLVNRFPKRGRLYVHLDSQRLKDGRVSADLGRSGRSGES